MAKMTNVLNDTQFKRLRESIEWSNQQLYRPKEDRINSIKQFVGHHSFQNAAAKRVPTPFLKLAVTIYVRSLAARAPRVMYSTSEAGFEPVAANLELAVNQIPAEIGLQDTLRRLVTEALFSGGWAKIGLHRVGELLGHEYGEPFVDVVTLDDLILDMTAKHYDQIQYIGNDYWLDYEDIMENDWFSKKAKKGLKPDEYSVIGEAGEERAEGISIDSSTEPFKEKILLRDVWIPKEKVLLTYAPKSERRLKTIDWSGPKLGPYHRLSFDDVPGNLMPLPPVATWIDLHEMANAIFRKLGDQADAQKTVLGFSGGDDDSVTAFKGAKDTDGITYQGKKPEKLEVGGVDQTTLAFWLQCRDIYSYFAGNLDSLGGLGPQTETVGQDKLISEASSAQLRDMASRVVDFCKGIFGSLAFYEWHDPVRRRQLRKSIPGTNLSIVVPWDRKSRQGKFDFYDLEIDVHSLQDDAPSIKLQKLRAILNEFVLPLMPAIEGQGGTFDVQEMLQDVAKYSDFEEINRWIIWADQPPGQGGESPGMPANTTRTYERVNRPGATDHGKSQILQQALLGGRPQESEMASLNRRAG
jgi:hypothetical protein